VRAVAAYLVEQQLLPLARTSEVMGDLLGVEMSEGTICDLIKRCAGQLVTVEQQIKEALKAAAIIHQDETGLYVAGKRQWMHVYLSMILGLILEKSEPACFDKEEAALIDYHRYNLALLYHKEPVIDGLSYRFAFLTSS
jgi:Transposase IS66 family